MTEVSSNKLNILKTVALALSIASLATACGSEADKKPKPTTAPEGSPELVKQEEQNAAELYAKARENLDKGYFKTAIEDFQEIEKLYPFSNLAPKAKVMTAYANFKNEDYDAAIGIIDNFVRLNPGNEEVSFMYYLKAMCYYQQITDIKRDQQVTHKAMDALEEIRSRFPGTDYDRDAKYKIALIRDHLAGKDMEVGRFYLKKNQQTAALNRFKTVVEKYQDTPQIEEALYRMVETNLMIGLKDEAVKYASILGHNYPTSKWYAYSLDLVNTAGPISVKEKGGKSWLDYVGLGKRPEAPAKSEGEITAQPESFDPEKNEKDVDSVINKVFN